MAVRPFAATTDALAQDPFELSLVPYPRQVHFRGAPFRSAPGLYLHMPSQPPTAMRLKAKIAAAQLSSAGTRTELSSTGSLNGFQSLLTSAPTVSKNWIRSIEQLRRRAIQRDGYILQATSEGILIKANDDTGFYYGCQTLRQLMLSGREVPGLEIEDAPLMPFRGIQMDLRGWPPTQDNLKWIIDYASSLKLNVLIIDYAEHFLFNSQPGLPSDEAYSPQFLAEMDVFAQDRGVLLIPLLQSLSNVEYVLRQEPYREMREDTRYFQQYCPSHPSTLEIHTAMVEDLIACHSTPYFHMGGEGARFLGMCPACSARVKQIGGKSALYLEHIGKVARYLNTRSKTGILWADVVRTMTDEQVKWLPEEMIFAVREYETQRGGGIAAALQVDLERLRGLGRPIWAATSRSISQGRRVFDYIDGWTAQAESGLIDGMLVTAPTRENSSGPLLEPLELTWPGVLHLAERCWSGLKTTAGDVLSRRIAAALYGTQSPAVQEQVSRIYDYIADEYYREARSVIKHSYEQCTRNHHILVFLDAWCRVGTFQSYARRFFDSVAADHGNIQAGTADPFQYGRLRWRVDDLKACVPDLVKSFRRYGERISTEACTEEFLNAGLTFWMSRLDDISDLLRTYPFPDEEWQQPVTL